MTRIAVLVGELVKFADFAYYLMIDLTGVSQKSGVVRYRGKIKVDSKFVVITVGRILFSFIEMDKNVGESGLLAQWISTI